MTAGSAAPLPINAGSLVQLTLSLVLVVALIFAITWVLKRFKLGAPRASRSMAVLDELAVGPRERVLLVRVGDAQVLLGVGSSGVVSLTPLSRPIELPLAAAEGSFAARLREFMQRGERPR